MYIRAVHVLNREVTAVKNYVENVLSMIVFAVSDVFFRIFVSVCFFYISLTPAAVRTRKNVMLDKCAAEYAWPAGIS